jgi:hypothetical protein
MSGKLDTVPTFLQKTASKNSSPRIRKIDFKMVFDAELAV